MSNPSLKEQLESLTIDFPKETHNHSKTTKPHPPKQKKEARPAEQKKQKPAWLEQVQYGVELLKAYYPNCFKEQKEIQPLKVGIKQDLVKGLAGRADIAIPDKACMINSLSYYVNAAAYHKSVQLGVTRIDLEGNEAGVVSQEEAAYSLERFQSKINKKKSTTQKKQTTDINP